MRDLMGMMKQAQALQEKMQALQDEIAALEVSGAAGGGRVSVVVDGRGALKSVKIDPSLANCGGRRTRSAGDFAWECSGNRRSTK